MSDVSKSAQVFLSKPVDFPLFGNCKELSIGENTDIKFDGRTNNKIIAYHIPFN